MCVQSAAGCLRLVELFEKYSLRSKKRADFDIWAEAVRLFATNLTHGSRHGTSPVKRIRDARLAELKERIQSGRRFEGGACTS